MRTIGENNRENNRGQTTILPRQATKSAEARSVSLRGLPDFPGTTRRPSAAVTSECDSSQSSTKPWSVPCCCSRFNAPQFAAPTVGFWDSPRRFLRRYVETGCYWRTLCCFIERSKSPKLATYPRYVKLSHSFRLFSKSTSRFRLTLDRSV